MAKKKASKKAASARATRKTTKKTAKKATRKTSSRQQQAGAGGKKKIVGHDPDRPVGDGNPPKHTQFGQPGGNPRWNKGRPKKVDLAQLLDQELARYLPGTSREEDKTYARAIIRNMVRQAIKDAAGSVKAASLIFNHHHGLPIHAAVSGEDGEPIMFVQKKLVDVDQEKLRKGTDGDE